jgi:hypothetical protein
MRNLIVCITAVVLLAVMPCKETSAQIIWDPGCAIEAAKKFQECKASGGRPFGCFLGAGFYYWQCSGSTIPMGPIRAARIGRKVVRRYGN